MHVLRFIVPFSLAGCVLLPALAEEHNAWPFRVEQTARGKSGAEQVTSWQGAGPFLFGETGTDDSTAGGFRPFYVHWDNPSEANSEDDFLYPLLTHRIDGSDSRWSLLELINFAGPENPHAPGARQFDVWPFYFSRNTGNPATTYHAVFPIYGSMVNRIGYDRLSWALFPLYGRLERKGVTTTGAPWPFLRVVTGNGNHGFALWPLFGWTAKAGVYRNQFYLWPLIYKNVTHPAAPQPTVSLGALPFYAGYRSANVVSETYLWPFFGYTKRRAPYRYHETRWFWPFLVQGRGRGHYVNRWGPVYTHSIIEGEDKRWYLWPLLRQDRWTAAGLRQTKTQFLYWIYWSLTERSVANPRLPPAEKTHLWPLLSYWDNGAGRRQLQIFSPLEVFFPENPSIQKGYNPFFALYRFDQRRPGDERWSLLWDAVTWQRTPTRREFHLGPLFSFVRSPRGRRVSFGHGLFGWKRAAGSPGWHPFLFDFSPNSHKKSQSAAKP